jgi:hypothetical protein
LNRYVTAIETYKLEVGSYPPDNGDLKSTATNDVTLLRRALAFNPLYYELGGAIFTNRTQPVFITSNRREEISVKALEDNFHRKGIQNSARSYADIPYKGMNFKESQTSEVTPLGDPNADVELLMVPVKGPLMLTGKNAKGGTNSFNPWYYDASTTNRHNRQTFDLWAEIVIRGETNVIANWKQ